MTYSKPMMSVSVGALVLVLGVASAAAAPQFAVWLDGNISGGGNGILTSLDNAFGVGDYTLVTTSQLETAGFLNAYQAVIVSRFLIRALEAV